MPKITFTETESAHVRIPRSLNNPFPASGELTLDLDALASEFCYPYPGKFISPYGYRGSSMHTGVDIKAIPNDTIRAAFSGVVRLSKLYSSYGNTVVIRHYNGTETVYSHNSKNLVAVNDVVQCGDPIALAGRTGRATTEHLHFEFRVASEALNPELLIDPNAQTLQRGTLYLYNRNGKVTGSNSVVRKGDPTQVAPSESTEAVYHTIQKGDTLYGLGRKYGTTVAKICALNGITTSTTIHPNQRLRIK